MSKSYDNTIPLFLGEKKLQKYINKIKTNLLEPGEPKDADDSAVFQLWSAFANEGQTQWMRDQFAEGIAWGEAKKQLFELIDTELQAPRALYMELLKAPDTIEEELQKGAEKARALARPLLDDLRNSVGIRPLG
jgi:tryptophanyl-tRNA synthetase